MVYRKNSFGNAYQESVKYNPEIYTVDSIAGKGPLLDGLSELKLYPGLYAKLNLSFEQDDNHYLTFGSNKDRNGYYVLLATEWKDQIGKVTYNGEKYFTSPESRDVIILVNMQKIKKLNIQQHTAGGREVK